MLHEFFQQRWIGLHGLVVMLGLAIYATASHTLRQRRHPSAAIAWVVTLVLIPYVALPLYLMFGRRKLVTSRRAPGALVAGDAQASSGKLPAQLAAQSGRLATAIGLAEAASFNGLDIHQDGGQALQALRSIIDSATQTLDVCSFLLGRDALGDDIANRLARRARDGVRVRLLVDGIGFYVGGRPSLKHLSAAGVQVVMFVSPFTSGLRGRTNLRNHRKMVIGDGQRLWCGGRNLAAEYFEGDPTSLIDKATWIDLSFDLSGDLAQQAQQRFEQDWQFALGKPAALAPPVIAMPEVPCTDTAAAPVNAAPEPPHPIAVRPDAALHARLVPSGPDQAEDTIYTLLVSGCFTAQRRILAVTPYFVPDQTLLLALTLAARRGVAVDLLLPLKSNHHLADIARAPALRELAAAGAKVWLAPGMMHAKAVLIDEGLALVGSANLDERSLFLNYELMVAFYDPPVVERFAQWIEVHRRDALPYAPRPAGLARELLEGVVRWVAFQL